LKSVVKLKILKSTFQPENNQLNWTSVENIMSKTITDVGVFLTLALIYKSIWNFPN